MRTPRGWYQERGATYALAETALRERGEWSPEPVDDFASSEVKDDEPEPIIHGRTNGPGAQDAILTATGVMVEMIDRADREYLPRIEPARQIRPEPNDEHERTPTPTPPADRAWRAEHGVPEARKGYAAVVDARGSPSAHHPREARTAGHRLRRSRTAHAAKAARTAEMTPVGPARLDGRGRVVIAAPGPERGTRSG